MNATLLPLVLQATLCIGIVCSYRERFVLPFLVWLCGNVFLGGKVAGFSF